MEAVMLGNAINVIDAVRLLQRTWRRPALALCRCRVDRGGACRAWLSNGSPPPVQWPGSLSPATHRHFNQFSA